MKCGSDRSGVCRRKSVWPARERHVDAAAKKTTNSLDLARIAPILFSRQADKRDTPINTSTVDTSLHITQTLSHTKAKASARARHRPEWRIAS